MNVSHYFRFTNIFCMKKIILLLFVVLFAQVIKSNAQNCPWTYSINGNDVTFNHMWPLAGIYTLDSIRLDYGDNSTQLKVSPNIGASTVHTYPGPGNYYACITRYISSLGNPGVAIPCTSCDSIVIASTNNCFVTAGFSPTIAGNTANFNNNTLCAVCTNISYSWDFGDGSPLSNALSPSHTYANAGNYVVCLIASGINPNLVTCSDTFCTNISIQAASTPCLALANFTFSTAGLNAAFTNTSTVTGGTISSYSWNFGDASPLSTLTSPTHTYANAGTYTVCLTVTGVDSAQNTCTDDTCFTVTVSPQGSSCNANANFSFALNQFTANFTNTSTCTNCSTTTYAWNFGNGQTSILQNPTHTYTANGVYNVCLIVTGTTATMQTCRDTLCQNVTVNVTGVGDFATQSLHIYPNPTKHSIWIDIPSQVVAENIVIQELTGRTVHQENVETSAHKMVLNVQHLSRGIYLIQLNTNLGRYTSKLIVE